MIKMNFYFFFLTLLFMMGVGFRIGLRKNKWAPIVSMIGVAVSGVLYLTVRTDWDSILASMIICFTWGMLITELVYFAIRIFCFIRKKIQNKHD